MTATREIVTDKRDEFAFHDDIAYLRETKRGLTRDTVEEISGFKDEPDWMLQYRLRAYEHFLKRPIPTWTDGLDKIDFDKIVYYRKPSEREEKSWDDVPEQIKATFERLGIPEAERKFLAGVGAQYDSEVVYHSVKEELTKLGVVFMGTDQALKEYPEIFRQYFGTVVPAGGQQVLGPQRGGLVGRLVRLRAQGRRGPAAAAGLLPDQRREHRPVRADADRRRRRRQGPLHRGLPAGGRAGQPRRCDGPDRVRGARHDGHEQRRCPRTGRLDSPPAAPGRRCSRSSRSRSGNAFELTPEHPVWTIQRERVAVSARKTRPTSRWDVDAREDPDDRARVASGRRAERGRPDLLPDRRQDRRITRSSPTSSCDSSATTSPRAARLSTASARSPTVTLSLPHRRARSHR